MFLLFEPLRGRRHVEVTDAPHRAGFRPRRARAGRRHYPDADTIGWCTDNLNTHTPAALYEAFPPDEARRIAGKLEFHYTPKHGSWLNMAETELSSSWPASASGRGSATAPPWSAEVAAWEAARNRATRARCAGASRRPTPASSCSACIPSLNPSSSAEAVH